MSIGRYFARLGTGTIGSILDLVGVVVWAIPGLFIFVALAGLLLAPVWTHLALYKWYYIGVLIIYVSVALVVLLRADRPGTNSTPVTGNSCRKSVGDSSRPTRGKALFRFTDNWLTGTGLFAGGSISKAEAIRIAGRTAIYYHLSQGNFAEHSGAITLTPKGHDHFLRRRARL